MRLMCFSNGDVAAASAPEPAVCLPRSISRQSRARGRRNLTLSGIMVSAD